MFLAVESICHHPLVKHIIYATRLDHGAVFLLATLASTFIIKGTKTTPIEVKNTISYDMISRASLVCPRILNTVAAI